MAEREGRSLTETPTWAVAAVIAIMVTLGFFFQGLLKHFGKWLDRTKRKALLAALEKIKEELMLFGLLSLLMGHWVSYVAKICVETPRVSSKFHSCLPESGLIKPEIVKHSFSSSNRLNYSVSRVEENDLLSDFCPEGRESFASYESLEQLHRFLFVLGITHVTYSFVAITLAMIKIYSWRTWENQAKAVTQMELQGSPRAVSNILRMRRLSTFISHHTSHPWSQHKVFVWLLCFSRQFWSSISQADYLALRLGFITTHQLPLSYDFHNYMVRSMEEEFRDIVGISVPLWIFGILCIFLGFHGTNLYFWLSFVPALLILSIGTKLHHVVLKLAIGIMDACPLEGFHQFNLRDGLFWFRKPKLLLHAIQFISFQNAFEMALFVWSLWESSGPSCFMENRSFIVIRLSFGLVSQFWCSFITFPLYVIVTQMGSRFKKSIIPERARSSLRRWRRRAKTRHGGSTFTLLGTESSESALDEMERIQTSSMEGSTSSSNVKEQQAPLPFTGSGYDSSDDDSNDDEHIDTSHVKDSSGLVLP